MKAVIEILEERISAAMDAVTGRVGCAAVVKPAVEARFGDYQANGVMPLAKSIGTNPRKLAADVVAAADVGDICEEPEVAGPGFINLRLKTDFVAKCLLQIFADRDSRLAISPAEAPQKVVVDFSGPNIAKQMHVGHLRSTIIGDCICRLLEFQQHSVIRQNHIGDWGTQFGMLIVLLRDKLDKLFESNSAQWIATLPLEDLEVFYREASDRYKTDSTFSDKAQAAVVGLHNGDPACLELWRMIVAESEKHYLQLYRQLSVSLKHEHTQGESFYRDMLADVVAELEKKGLAVKSDGAVCVFPPGFKNKEGKDLPFIIQKSDGAFLYATTDLAALRYRLKELGAKRIVYVTDARQKLHFEMLFAVGKMAAWVDEKVELSHVMFGSVLGEDGKPFKTRSGENVKLKDLLDEAVQRAKAVVEEKNPELDEKKKGEVAKAVGIGAVKYADYSNNRTSDYVFSFERMLAMEGNTAPYMQYAYARIKSIERKGQSRDVDIETELAELAKLNLSEAEELALAKHLICYGQIIADAAADYRPNFLTAYLYDLAQKFSVFYTNCPVLKAPPDKRGTRLLLCDLTARTIRHGLSEVLGIAVVEQM